MQLKRVDINKRRAKELKTVSLELLRVTKKIT